MPKKNKSKKVKRLKKVKKKSPPKVVEKKNLSPGSEEKPEIKKIKKQATEKRIRSLPKTWCWANH